MVVLTGTRDQENVYLQVVWFENNHVIGSEDTMNVCDLLSSTLKPCNYYSDDVNVYNNMLHTHTHTHTHTHSHTHTHIHCRFRYLVHHLTGCLKICSISCCCIYRDKQA